MRIGLVIFNCFQKKEADLKRIEEEITECMRLRNIPLLNQLHTEKEEIQNSCDKFMKDISCLKRLASSTEMCEVIKQLKIDFLDDEQRYVSFIHASWSAYLDYSKDRENKKKALKLSKDISETAKILKTKILELKKTHTNFPVEFHSIQNLLEKTGHDSMWHFMRHKVLRNKTPNDDINYTWGVAPQFHELLDTIKNVADQFDPQIEHMMGWAVSTRQKSIKTEYLRAFCYLLVKTHGFSLETVSVKKAIAEVTNVVLNNLKELTTYDDVRKLVEALKKELSR